MDIKMIVISLLLGYACGNLPSGYLYARSQGVDIFKVGSGNPGSTNILRTFGKKAGITVLFMDIAKTILPIIFLHILWKPDDPGVGTLITMYTGVGAILGHNFPCIPHLHGGKGVACTGALAIAFDWKLAIVLLLFFAIIVIVTRYVSLGSILAVSAFFFSVLFLGKSGYLPVDDGIYIQCCVLVFLLDLLCIFQHRENIVRLLKGQENRFGSKSK